MFDNLRNDTSFFDDNVEEVKAAPSKQTPSRPKRKKGQLLGMTPMQRFIITMMLLIAVGLLGTVTLLLTGKFWLA